jgi:hypothetical protein
MFAIAVTTQIKERPDDLKQGTGGARREFTETQRSAKCRQQEVLLGRLQADTKVFSEITQRLESCKAGDFEQTYRAAESARLAFLRAREALNVHRALHGCEESDLIE